MEKRNLMNTQPLTSSQEIWDSVFAASNLHKPHFLVRGVPIAPEQLLLQPFGTALLISVLFNQVTFSPLTTQKCAAPLLKVSPWAEGASAVEISVPRGKNTAHILRMLC